MWVYHRIPLLYHITRLQFAFETDAELFQLCIICFHCLFTNIHHDCQHPITTGAQL